MSIGAFNFTDDGFLAVRKGTIDMEADVIVCILVDAAQAASLTADNAYSDVSANEVDTATYPDYVQKTVGSILWTKTATRNFKLDAAKVVFGTAVTISAKYAYFLKMTDGIALAVADPVVGIIDLDTAVATNVGSVNNVFEVDFNAGNGLMTDALTP